MTNNFTFTYLKLCMRHAVFLWNEYSKTFFFKFTENSPGTEMFQICKRSEV